MATDLSGVLRPVAKANGLPNEHYVDDRIFMEERDAVLFKSWSGVGVTADVPEPGDAKPIEFLGMPLLLIRDKDGDIRVFQNTCRHRGMILVAEPKKIEGAIRCPYHSWCYSTKGKLVATPHVGGPGMNTHEDMPKNDLGLIEVPSHIWLGVIYVNVSGTAAPFEDVHAELLERWKEFDVPLHHGGEDSTFTLDVQTNWKLAVENYCESYHLPWVHPGLNSYSRLEDHYNIEEYGQYSGQGTLVYRQLEGQMGERFPDFPNLSDKWDTGGEYITVYPNVLLGVQRDHAFAIILEPKAVDRTIEHIHLFYAEPKVDEALRAKNATQWKTVFQEDVFVVEGMQKGRNGHGFDGGRFSPAMDVPTHCFHDWVARQLIDHRQRVAAE